MTAAAILKNYFFRLYKIFLENHVKAQTLLPTTEEEDCVKAFCVLAHAAVEEFLETISKETLTNAYKKYKSKVILSKLATTQADLDVVNLRVIQLIESLVLATNFSTFSSQKSDTLKNYKSKLERVTEIYKAGNNPTLNDLTELTKKTDSYTKELIKETIQFYDSHIESNNGASLKYLLRLLIPVGIDIPNVIELNSLQKLAEYRGSYAHGKGFSQILSASDLVNYAKDVTSLCKTIENSIDDFTLL